MAQLKRLLAATDFSAPARHAVERAASVARAAGAELHLVHVGAFSRLDELRRLVANLPADIRQRILEQTEMMATALAASVRERHGVRVTPHVASGPLLSGIEETATSLQADLLVLGSRGSGTLRHLVLGSTAARLVGAFSRPLLVVKRAPAVEYRCVLVPVDFSDASLPAVRLAHAAAPQAHLVLMHAYEAPFEGKLRMTGIEEGHLEEYRRRARAEAEAGMAGLCRSAGIAPGAVASVLVHGTPAQRILEQEDYQDCDLIVTGRQGRGRVRDMLVGSVSRRLLAESEADVLVVP